MANTMKVTISLPKHILEAVDAVARERKAPRSSVIAQMLEKDIEGLEEREMIEGYCALAEENLAFAESVLPLAQEVLPEWD